MVKDLSDQEIWNLKRAVTTTARCMRPTAPPSSTRASRP
ncbi:hypothetical protein I553_8052 [Mycobacterium xenopi 4042]|uniref:Uncharacterized protein n=1 Tax=Mycobacterium xenopi 4042 TaxID=1299334 RepID=X8DDL0_MYCXE|nr:hypothetical protein I553_8052 [Mycobacterium xenopi 4042]